MLLFNLYVVSAKQGSMLNNFAEVLPFIYIFYVLKNNFQKFFNHNGCLSGFLYLPLDRVKMFFA